MPASRVAGRRMLRRHALTIHHTSRYRAAAAVPILAGVCCDTGCAAPPFAAGAFCFLISSPGLGFPGWLPCGGEVGEYQAAQVFTSGHALTGRFFVDGGAQLERCPEVDDRKPRLRLSLIGRDGRAHRESFTLVAGRMARN